MDPITLLAIISQGLGLVDKFYDLTKKIQGETPKKHRVEVKPRDNKLVVEEDGYEQEIHTSDLQLHKFDKVRHDTLMKRIDINWRRYNGLDVQRASASADEKVRLEIQMEQLKSELCPDFKELVRIYEEVLSWSLPDHYTLYDICA